MVGGVLVHVGVDAGLQPSLLPPLDIHYPAIYYSHSYRKYSPFLLLTCVKTIAKKYV